MRLFRYSNLNALGQLKRLECLGSIVCDLNFRALKIEIVRQQRIQRQGYHLIVSGEDVRYTERLRTNIHFSLRRVSYSLF